MRIGFASPIFLKPLAPWLDVADADVLPDGYGHGVSTHIALALLHEGHELEIVALDPSVTTPQQYQGPKLGLQVGPYRHRGRARDAFRAERTFISHALRRVEPELVHAHWTYEFALGALASGSPTLVTVNDWAPTICRLNPDPYRAIRLLMQATTLARGQFFTAPSPHIASKVAGWRRAEIPVVPHGLPDEAFRSTPRSPRPSRLMILAVNSGFSPFKNVQTLLQAFPLVREQVPDAALHLVGSDYERGGAAERWAVERLLTEGVYFRGVQSEEDMRATLEEADVFVHPSREESFGLAVVEAMAQGLPVVGGTASGAVPWLLEEGRVGNLADIRSPRSLAGAICGVMQSGERWRQCSERGYESARRRFRFLPIVRAYEQQYENVLDAAKRERRGTRRSAGGLAPRSSP